MLEIAPGEWVHVRGDALDVEIACDDACGIRGVDDSTLNRLIELQGCRVLILELVE